jgi:hypothetical protein
VLLAPKSLSGRFRSTTRRRGGGFAKQVSGNVEQGKTPTFLRVGLRIRFDENLDSLFAGVDLDTNSLFAEVDFVASPVLSSNDRVGHYRVALGINGTPLSKLPVIPV